MLYKKLTKMSDTKWELFKKVFDDSMFRMRVREDRAEFECLFLDKNVTLNKGIHIFSDGSISFVAKDKNGNIDKRINFLSRQVVLIGSGVFFDNELIEYSDLENSKWEHINRQVNNTIKEYRGPGGREWETLSKKETLTSGLFYNANLKEIVIPIKVSGDGPYGGWSSHIINHKFSTNELNIKL